MPFSGCGQYQCEDRRRVVGLWIMIMLRESSISSQPLRPLHLGHPARSNPLLGFHFSWASIDARRAGDVTDLWMSRSPATSSPRSPRNRQRRPFMLVSPPFTGSHRSRTVHRAERSSTWSAWNEIARARSADRRLSLWNLTPRPVGNVPRTGTRDGRVEGSFVRLLSLRPMRELQTGHKPPRPG